MKYASRGTNMGKMRWTVTWCAVHNVNVSTNTEKQAYAQADYTGSWWTQSRGGRRDLRGWSIVLARANHFVHLCFVFSSLTGNRRWCMHALGLTSSAAGQLCCPRLYTPDRAKLMKLNAASAASAAAVFFRFCDDGWRDIPSVQNRLSNIQWYAADCVRQSCSLSFMTMHARVYTRISQKKIKSLIINDVIQSLERHLNSLFQVA